MLSWTLSHGIRHGITALQQLWLEGSESFSEFSCTTNHLSKANPHSHIDAEDGIGTVTVTQPLSYTFTLLGSSQASSAYIAFTKMGTDACFGSTYAL